MGRSREFLQTLSFVTTLMFGVIQDESSDFIEMEPLSFHYFVVFVHSLAIYSALNSIIGTVITYHLSAIDTENDQDYVNITVPSFFAAICISSYLLKFGLRHVQTSFYKEYNNPTDGYVDPVSFFFAYGVPLYFTIISLPFQIIYYIRHREFLKGLEREKNKLKQKSTRTISRM